MVGITSKRQIQVPKPEDRTEQLSFPKEPINLLSKNLEPIVVTGLNAEMKQAIDHLIDRHDRFSFLHEYSLGEKGLTRFHRHRRQGDLANYVKSPDRLHTARIVTMAMFDLYGEKMKDFASQLMSKKTSNVGLNDSNRELFQSYSSLMKLMVSDKTSALPIGVTDSKLMDKTGLDLGAAISDLVERYSENGMTLNKLFVDMSLAPIKHGWAGRSVFPAKLGQARLQLTKDFIGQPTLESAKPLAALLTIDVVGEELTHLSNDNTFSVDDFTEKDLGILIDDFDMWRTSKTPESVAETANTKTVVAAHRLYHGLVEMMLSSQDLASERTFSDQGYRVHSVDHEITNELETVAQFNETLTALSSELELTKLEIVNAIGDPKSENAVTVNNLKDNIFSALANPSSGVRPLQLGFLAMIESLEGSYEKIAALANGPDVSDADMIILAKGISELEVSGLENAVKNLDSENEISKVVLDLRLRYQTYLQLHQRANK